MVFLILKRQLMNMLFIFKDAQEKALKTFICLIQEIMITMRKILSIRVYDRRSRRLILEVPEVSMNPESPARDSPALYARNGQNPIYPEKTVKLDERRRAGILIP